MAEAGGRRDPLPALLAAAAAVVYLLHGFGDTLTRDLGVYAYAGQRVADGVVPYVGIFNRAGPLAHLLPAVGVLGARVVGADELLGMRVFFLVLAVATVPVTYLLARDLFRSRCAGVAAAVALVAFPAVSAYAGSGPREKTPMLLFMVLALWALVHRRWLASGVLVALATLVLQISLITLVPPALAAVWALAPERRLRALTAVAAGGAATLAATVACFAVVGRLRAFVDGFLVANARYTTSSGALSEVRRVRGQLADGFELLLPVLLLGLLALLSAALVLLLRGAPEDPARLVVAGTAAGAVAGALWTLRDFDSWPDTYPLLPFSALGIGASVALLRQHAGPRVALTTTVGWTVLALALGATYAVTERNGRLAAQQQSVAAALEVLPGARIVSVEAPHALVLAGQVNPSRHQMFASGLKAYVADTWPGGFPGFLRSLRSGPQELVAVNARAADVWSRRLAPRYELVGRAPEIRWFADTGLDPALRDRLRDALRSVDRR